MGQECLFPSERVCYCFSVLINTIREGWIFSGLQPGQWKNPLPWAPSLVHRAVICLFLLRFPNPRGGPRRDKGRAGRLNSRIGELVTQHFLICAVGSPLFQAVLGTWCKLFFYSIPPPSEVRISICKEQRCEEVHSGSAASDTRAQDHSISDFGGFNAFCAKKLGNKGCPVRNVHICILFPRE